jgi:hypothetical protein
VKSGRISPNFQRCLLPPSSGRPDDGGLVYETKVAGRPALLRRSFAAAEHIRNHTETSAEATQSLLMRVDKCTECQAGHFEQLL